MKRYELENGHSITVEEANRGLEDDYKISFFEDNMKLDEEYGNKEYIEWYYGVAI